MDTQAQPADPHGCTQACAPATHRPPEPTAAAESRRCSLGRPQSGSPCCGWPSCAPAWASSTDSPGGHGGGPHGLLTLAAPSKAPRGAHRGRRTQAHVGSGKAPPTNVPCSPPMTPKPSPSSLLHGPFPGWGAAYPTDRRPLCRQPPEGDQGVHILGELITAEGFPY